VLRRRKNSGFHPEIFLPLGITLKSEGGQS